MFPLTKSTAAADCILLLFGFSAAAFGSVIGRQCQKNKPKIQVVKPPNCNVGRRGDILTLNISVSTTLFLILVVW